MTTRQGDLPVIHVKGNDICEGYQNAVLAVFDNGARIETPKHTTQTPLGWDATVTVEIADPQSLRRIHKIGIPGFIPELEVYRLEAVWGIHNNWVGDGWDYTYHERIFEYRLPDGSRVNQIANMIKVIKSNYKEKGRVSGRDFQVSTWMPWNDPFVDDPPCLQRIHFRLFKSENEGEYLLHMTTHWRSRDLFKAWCMNVYAMTDLQRLVAKWISEELGFPVFVGKYIDISNSLHLYGAYAHDIEGAVMRMREKNHYELSWEITEPNLNFHEEVIATRRLAAAQNKAEATGHGKMIPKDRLIELGYEVDSFEYPKEWDE